MKNKTQQETLTKTNWTPSKKSGDALNKIVRGEISAVEAYTEVMEKLSADAEIHRLQEILDTHRKHVGYFKRMALNENEMPDYDSGPWGTVVSLFVKSAKLLGNTAALKSLKEGEEHGLSEYERLLENDDVPNEVKTEVKDRMIPSLNMHINSIDAMMKMQ